MLQRDDQNSPHKDSHEASRALPLLVGDYGFVKSSTDAAEHSQTVLVLRIGPYMRTFASIVPVKGLDIAVAKRVVRIIRGAGLVHFAYKSDR